MKCEYAEPPAGVTCGDGGNVHGNMPDDCVITRFPVVTPALPLLPDLAEPQRVSGSITRTALGEVWPFTVDKGILACAQGAVTFEDSEGRVWALNDAAADQGTAALDETIWRPDGAALGQFGTPGPDDPSWRDEAELRESLKLALPDEYPERFSVPLSDVVEIALTQCDQRSSGPAP